MSVSYIKNIEELTMNGLSQKDRNARRSLLLSLDKAIASADPYKSVSSRFSDKSIFQMTKSIELKDFRKIFVVGAGKAGGMMAKAVEDKLGEVISEGW
ncbi:MAG: DUF4147 domain-containing protein, partial [Candidatus Korarchaeum sp.]